MSIFIIADLHLSANTQTLNTEFEMFCNKLKKGDELYIIGDFLAYFIGIENFTNSIHSQIKQITARLHNLAIPVYFIHGNRDFLMTSQMATELGFILLPDTYTLDVYNQKILLLHGDELCTKHISYTCFRKFSRVKLFQKIFLALTTENYRKKIAENMRKNSQKKFNTHQVKEKINQDLAIKYLKRFNCNVLIHGHTHDVSTTLYQDKKLIDTGDWREDSYTFIEIKAQEPYIFIYRKFYNSNAIELISKE